MSRSLNTLVGSDMIPIGVQVKAGQKIEKSAGVCYADADGYSINIEANATARKFQGFAEDGVDNSYSGATDGGEHARVIPAGFKLVPTIAGATGAANTGADVFMSDPFTFTLSADDGGGGNYVKIGKVFSHIVGEGFYVWFEADAMAFSA